MVRPSEGISGETRHHPPPRRLYRGGFEPSLQSHHRSWTQARTLEDGCRSGGSSFYVNSQSAKADGPWWKHVGEGQVLLSDIVDVAKEACCPSECNDDFGIDDQWIKATITREMQKDVK